MSTDLDLDIDLSYLTPTRTARHTLHGVHIPRNNPKPVTLIVKSGGEDNERYMSALAKAPPAFGVDGLKQSATLLARYVVVGWEDVLDRNGEPAACTPERVELVLHTCIEKKQGLHYLLPLRDRIQDPSNFREPIANAVDLGNG